MNIESFNRKIIEAEEKLFDAEYIITGTIVDMLNLCSNRSADIYAEIPFMDNGYRTFVCERIFLNEETGAIFAREHGGNSAPWDSFDPASKLLLLNELYQKICSDSLYQDLSKKDEVH